MEEKGDVKYTHLRQFITANKIDIIVIPECNTNWDKMEYNQRLQECTKGWWESVQWATAHNRLDENSGRHQPGRVALGIFNMLVHQAS